MVQYASPLIIPSNSMSTVTKHIAPKLYGASPFNMKKIMGNMKDRLFTYDVVDIPGKDWQMGKYTVTQKQWKTIMGTEPWIGETFSKYVKEGDDYPAVFMTWDEAQEFIEKLNSTYGKDSYRLPMEDEWEYACRAGSTTKYYFSNNSFALGRYAWYYNNAWNVGEEYAHEVGQKIPNDWGLYDMLGNVRQWCQDIWNPGDIERVCRGNDFIDKAEDCTPISRAGSVKGEFRIGIRLVKNSSVKRYGAEKKRKNLSIKQLKKGMMSYIDGLSSFETMGEYYKWIRDNAEFMETDAEMIKEKNKLRKELHFRPKKKECFYTAFLAMADDIDYYEGWVLCPDLGFPIEHAWNVKNGRVIDFTAGLGLPDDCIYYGLKLPNDYVREKILEYGHSNMWVKMYIHEKIMQKE